MNDIQLPIGPLPTAVRYKQDLTKLERENTRLRAAIRIIQEITRLVSASPALRVEDIIEQLTSQLVRTFDYTMVAIYLRDGDEFKNIAAQGDLTKVPDVQDLIYLIQRVMTSRSLSLKNFREGVPQHHNILNSTREIAIPMRQEQELLGIIYVKSNSVRGLLQDDVDLLETLNEQLTTAIVNVQRVKETERYALQLETASEVSRRVTSILNIDQLLTEVVQLIQGNFGYYHTHIFIYEPATDTWVMRAGSGRAAERMKEVRHTRLNEEGVVGQAGSTGMSILVPDVSQEPRHVFNPYLPDTKAELAIPLRLGTQVFGVLDVQSSKLYGLTESDRALMETLGNQIAVALNNAQLFSEIEQQLAEREKLYRVSSAISRAQEMQEILSAILEPLAEPTIISAALLLFATDSGRKSQRKTLKVAALWSSERESHSQHWAGIDLTTIPTLDFISISEEAKKELLVINDVASNPSLDLTTRSILQQARIEAIALVRLRAGNQLVGWLLLMSKQKDALDEALLQPYQTLADQAALAVVRVQLLVQTHRRAKRLGALYTLSTNITASLDMQQTLQDSVRTMAHLFEVRQSGLLMYEAENRVGRLVAQYREDGFKHIEDILVPLVDNPLIEELFKTRQPIYIRDVSNETIARTIRAGTHPRSYNSMLVIPLLTHDRVIGSISLDVVKGTDRPFEPEQMELAQTMAAQITAAIEKAQLYQETRRRAYEMETASRIGQHLTRVLNEEMMIADVVSLIARRFNFYHVAIYLQDQDYENRLNLHASSLPLEQNSRHRHSLWKGQGLVGHVLENSEVIVTNDISKEERFKSYANWPKSAAEAAIPLIVGGTLLGVLDIHSDKKDIFQNDTMSVLTTIADQIAIALQNARLFATQRETVQRLQEVDRLKSEFLASMSHELRTPLNSIIGFSKIILRGISGPLTEYQQQDLTAIYNSGQHLLALINEILDLSKIAAGQMELNITCLDFKEISEEVLRELSPQAREKSLRLEHTHEENLPHVLADRIRVRQILLNLVSNGIKFTEKGGVYLSSRRVARALPLRGQKECVADPQGKYIEITIQDTGIGVKAEDQETLFEAFQQVGSHSRRRGGTGLGLTIARRIAELHGSSLWVESRYGIGSTFRFTLPIANQT